MLFVGFGFLTDNENAFLDVTEAALLDVVIEIEVDSVTVDMGFPGMAAEVELDAKECRLVFDDFGLEKRRKVVEQVVSIHCSLLCCVVYTYNITK